MADPRVPPLPPGDAPDAHLDQDMPDEKQSGMGRGNRDGTSVASAFDAHNLNEFLGDLHTSSTVADKDGMPSLQWLRNNFATKSGRIRYLTEKSFTPKEIADHLHIKYQHAYNVANQVLKRGPNEVYVERSWQCTHTNRPFVDVIVRTGERDPNAGRVLYRVCTTCATGLIPGVTSQTLETAIPGILNNGKEQTK